MKTAVLSILLATSTAFAAPVDPASLHRDDLIAALHEIHRDERLPMNTAEAVEYAAIAAQVTTLAATGTLAILVHNERLKIGPKQLAAVSTYLDYAVKYAPAAFVASAVIAIGASTWAAFTRAHEALNPIDVRTEEGFTKFLAAPVWRQIQIAEADPEFEARLIAYADELRKVRAEFKPIAE